MTAGFLRVESQQLKQLQADPDSLETMLDNVFEMGMGGSKRDDYCDVDKSWQTIHYLLSGGDPWNVTNTESQAVLGGTEFGPDMGYGPPRFLSVEQVKQVAEAIAPIDEAELERRFDPKAMAGADLYAFSHDHPEDELEMAQHYFKDLRTFYSDAAQQDAAVLLFII